MYKLQKQLVTFTYNPGGTSTITPALQVSTYSFDGTVKVADGQKEKVQQLQKKMEQLQK